MTFLNKDVVIQMLKILAESTLDELHLEMGELKLIAKKHAVQRAIQELEVRRQESIEPPVCQKSPVIPPPEEPQPPAEIPSEDFDPREGFSLHLDEEGDFIDEWPGGFFPERLRELR